MRTVALLAGVAFVALGVAGTWYASAIVAAQHREAMTPVEDDRIGDDDRIRVTQRVGVLFVVAGFGLLAYGLEVIG